MEKILSQSVEMLRLYIVTQNCVPMQVTRLPNCVHIVVTTHVEAVCLLGREIVNDKNVESAHVDYEPKDAECLKSAKGSAS